jgi:hypothetical protein
MTTGKLMTMEEKTAIDMRCHVLREAGKEKEAMELAKTIPLSPALAQLWKKRFGADVLLKSGWNLAEAEAKFGRNWLSN